MMDCLEPLSFFENIFDSSDCFLGDQDEIGVLKPDQELFPNYELPSIKSDVEKINETSSLGSYENASLHDIKPEIRNSDCMWSGNGSGLSTSASSSFSDVTTAFPLSTVTGNTQNIINNIKQEDVSEPYTIVANNSQTRLYLQNPTIHPQPKQMQFLHTTKATTIKIEPIDDVEQSQFLPSIPTNIRQPLQQQHNNSMQNIPPGTSLLRKSNQQLKKQKLNDYKSSSLTLSSSPSLSSGSIVIPNGAQTLSLKTNIETLDCKDFKDRAGDPLIKASPISISEALLYPQMTNTIKIFYGNATYVRPDTPHSLDDEVTCMPYSKYNTAEFKSNIDLGGCVIGSNNINLPNDSQNIINQLSQELQDSSKKEIDSRLIKEPPKDLSDVLDILNRDSEATSNLQQNNGNSIAGKTYSDDFYEESNAGSNSASSLLDSSDTYYKTSLQSPNSYKSSSPSPTNNNSNSNSNASSHHHNHHHNYAGYLHSDHSYTRYTDGMDDSQPHMETPSDSDEEIDVVSINDKKLPTNPSDKDRRVIQTKVADKFSNARVVKTSNGVRTIPPRRSASYEFPYTPASNSPEKSNSRYSSPASTPYHSHHLTKYDQQQQHQQQQQQIMLQQNEKARKRILQSSSCSSSSSSSSNGSYINVGIDYDQNGSIITSPLIKRQRGKKPKHAQQQQIQNASPIYGLSNVVKRQYSIDENADTIEKRNLHNDMERQRRIGLKNLFETLKKQIPSIKDKERAPKVNILREAAKLCEALTSEDNKLTAEKALMKEEQRRKRSLLARLHSLQAIEID